MDPKRIRARTTGTWPGAGTDTFGSMAIHDSIEILAAIYGPFTEDHRVAESAIIAAESRLGFRLPSALRTLYAETGESAPLHASHNALVPLYRADFAGDHLVFYEENQSVVVWGIERARLAEDDPPVDQGQLDQATGVWSFVSEFASVSEFACAQGAWQAVQGGLPFVGVIENHPYDHLEPMLGPPTVITNGMSIWVGNGGVAVELPGGYVGLATQSAAQFSVTSARIGLAIDQWDYATLRDE